MTDGPTTDPEVIERKRSRQKQDKQTNDTIIRVLMGRQDGRRWVWLKLSECHIFEQVACFGEDAVRRTYFASGERNIGLKLMADIMKICPAEFVLAMQENSKLELQDNATGSGEPNPDDTSSDGDDSSSG